MPDLGADTGAPMAGLDTAYRNGKPVRWRRDEWARLGVRREQRLQRPGEGLRQFTSLQQLQRPTVRASEAATRIVRGTPWLAECLAQGTAE